MSDTTDMIEVMVPIGPRRVNIRRVPRRQSGLSILLTGGIGDIFAVEALLAPEERDRLEEVYYACAAWREIRELFQALQKGPLPRLSCHTVLPTGGKVFLSKDEVEKATGKLPEGVLDCSIGAFFSSRWTHHGSSFLSRRLASPALPPSPYVVVVPGSDWGRWAGRSFDEADWKVLTDFLEGRQLWGVVLRRSSHALPAHPRLLDWQGKTSICESVEVLKAAQGYMGIDSCLAVLAGRHFPAQRLAVKSVADQHYANLANYYAPRRQFDFVRRALHAPEWD